MNKYEKYLAVANWAKRRYISALGSLELATGANLRAYSRIETAAARKYLGFAA